MSDRCKYQLALLFVLWDRSFYARASFSPALWEQRSPRVAELCMNLDFWLALSIRFSYYQRSLPLWGAYPLLVWLRALVCLILLEEYVCNVYYYIGSIGFRGSQGKTASTSVKLFSYYLQHGLCFSDLQSCGWIVSTNLIPVMLQWIILIEEDHRLCSMN